MKRESVDLLKQSCNEKRKGYIIVGLCLGCCLTFSFLLHMTAVSKKKKKNKNKLNNYHVQLLSKRAVRVLDAREKAFKEAHINDTDVELLNYVLKQTLALGHSPRSGEIEGWRYLEERFKSWDAILKRLHLDPYKSNETYRKYILFQKEFDHQLALYKEHKKYQKQKSLERRLKQAETKKANEAYLAEHPEARKKKKKSPSVSDQPTDVEATDNKLGQDENKETE